MVYGLPSYILGIVMKKVCTVCGKLKSVSDFYKDLSQPNGLKSSCKECKKMQQREYKKTGRWPKSSGKKWGPGYWKKKKRHWKPTKVGRRKYRLKQYGLTLEDYDVLFEKQKGVCAICSRSPKKVDCRGVGILFVDHDHKTGVVRGLLCHHCNAALGLIKDDVLILEAMIEYLEGV